MSNLWNKIDEINFKNWNNFVNNEKNSFITLNQEEAEAEINSNLKSSSSIIKETLDSKEFVRNLSIIKDEKTINTNVFFVFNPTYGGICNGCNSDMVFFFAEGGIKKEVNEKYCVFSPAIEDVILAFGRDEKVIENKLKNKQSLALEIKDGKIYNGNKFFCSKCQTWHDVTYDSNVGLRFK